MKNARVSALLALAAFGGAACAESVREFSSAPPTLTATSPRAATTSPGAITAVPTTAAPPTTTPSSPSVAPTSAAPASATPTRTASPTTAPTATGTPQPTLPPGASLPPMPAQPALSSSTIIATGTVTFSIAPGETRRFEPSDLASARGASPPPSAALAWTIAWRATESLTSAWYRQTSRTELGRGRWGTADLGGAGFELRNDTGASVFGELAYTIGSR